MEQGVENEVKDRDGSRQLSHGTRQRQASGCVSVCLTREQYFGWLDNAMELACKRQLKWNWHLWRLLLVLGSNTVLLVFQMLLDVGLWQRKVWDCAASSPTSLPKTC